MCVSITDNKTYGYQEDTTFFYPKLSKSDMNFHVERLGLLALICFACINIVNYLA